MAPTVTRLQDFDTNQRDGEIKPRLTLHEMLRSAPRLPQEKNRWISGPVSAPTLHPSKLSYTDYLLKALILLAMAENAPDDSRVCDEAWGIWADVMLRGTCWHQSYFSVWYVPLSHSNTYIV